MIFHFCQNDRNEITPATSFISGCVSCKQLQEIDQTPNWKYFTSPEMKSHVNTLLGRFGNYFFWNIFTFIRFISRNNSYVYFTCILHFVMMHQWNRMAWHLHLKLTLHTDNKWFQKTLKKIFAVGSSLCNKQPISKQFLKIDYVVSHYHTHLF